MTVVSVKNVKGHLAEVKLSSGKTVYIERDFAAEIPLKAGMTFGEDELSAVVKESEYRRAKARALYFLDRADRTEKVLIRKITEGGIEKSAAEKAVKRLKELGLVDDFRFAENAYSHLAEQNVSKRAAYAKLYEKGVPPEIIKQVLENDTETDEVSQVTAVIEKKYKNKLCAADGAKKTAAALIRKGFSYASVREAMRKFSNDTDFEED